MSARTPENPYSRYKNMQELAQKHWDRALIYMGVTGLGVMGLMANAAILTEKYFPLTNTLEEIQQGKIDPSTETALLTSIVSMGGLELVSAIGLVGVSYHAFKRFLCSREADNLKREMENQSKRPPTLGY